MTFFFCVSVYSGEDSGSGGGNQKNVSYMMGDPQRSFNSMSAEEALWSRHLNRRFPNIHVPGTSSYVKVTTLCVLGDKLWHDDGVRYIDITPNFSLTFSVDFYRKTFSDRFDRDKYLGSHRYSYRMCN